VNIQLPTPAHEPPSKSPDAISGMFNRIAKTYDLLNDCMTAGMHRHWKKQACRALNLKPGDSVLDVCTGTGDLAAILSGMVGRDGKVTAIDFSEEMLEIARDKYKNIDNISWVQGDALALPFEDNQFDGVIVSFGLRNVASVPGALAEMARVVRPGGWVVNLDTASDCKNPLFWFYFSTVMPLLGKLVAGDYTAYQYLCRSTQTFETPEQIAAHLRQFGLNHNRIIYLALGSVSYQAGCKLGVV
jgi:demethylmenaquinone methyltransferase / 2-methoxy-6-polyprenyl-1,4-benzoquinol methylase